MLPSIVSELNTVSLLAQINILRHDQGQSKIQNSKFNAIVVDECPEIGSEMPANFATISNYHKTTSVEGYVLTPDQAILIGMRVSKSVRRGLLRWIRSLEQSAVTWSDKRESLKESWWEVQDVVKLYYGEPKGYDYANEQNLIYRTIFGKTAQQLKRQYGLSDVCAAKDGMTEEELETVAALETGNSLFMQSGMEYSARKVALRRLLNSRRLKLG